MSSLTWRHSGATKAMPDTADFLRLMAASSARRSEAARESVSMTAIREYALAEPAAPVLRFGPDGFDLIAELKLESPSAGSLGCDPTAVEQRVSEYARSGAAAVSVLTEPTRFGGHLEHLRTAAKTLAPLGVPAMRKDFLVDSYQVFEARAAGAGGVLLIVRMLDDAGIEELTTIALGLGMFVLLEAFDSDDLARLTRLTRDLPADAPLLAGLNTRDLATFEVEPNRLKTLVSEFPPELPKVAESGILTPAHAREAAACGYRFVLVGTALMRADAPGRLLAQMLAAGRGA